MEGTDESTELWWHPMADLLVPDQDQLSSANEKAHPPTFEATQQKN